MRGYMPVLEKQKPLSKYDCEDCICLASDEIRDYYFCVEHSVSDADSLKNNKRLKLH